MDAAAKGECSVTETPAKQRIEAIDLVKGLAIIAVVLGHVLVDRGFLNAWVYSFQVPLFFFAAGLVFSAKPRDGGDGDGEGSGDGEGGAYAGFGAFAVKKLRQLMLPYAAFGLVAIAVYLALGALAASILGRGAADLTLGDCLFGLVYGNAALPQLYFYRPLWFLPCLFVMEALMGALAFPLAKAAKPQVRAAVIMAASIVLAAAGLVYRAKVGSPLPWGIETACILLPFFGAGFALRTTVPPADLGERLAGTARRRIVTAAAGAALLAAGVALAHLNYTQSGLQSVAYVVNDYRVIWAFYLSAALQCAAFTCLAFALGRCRPLAYLGRHTLWILGLHKYPILALQILPLTAGALAANNILVAAVAVAVAIGFSLAVEVLVKRGIAALRKRR